MKLDRQKDNLFSMGVWTSIAILEKDYDKLSVPGQVALALLKSDLKRMAEDE